MSMVGAYESSGQKHDQADVGTLQGQCSLMMRLCAAFLDSTPEAEVGVVLAAGLKESSVLVVLDHAGGVFVVARACGMA